MKIPTNTHNTKNIQSHISPNAYFVHLESNHRIGASGAVYVAKKNNNHKTIKPIPIWYLLSLKVDLDLERLLLAKTKSLKINIHSRYDYCYYFQLKIRKKLIQFFTILCIIFHNKRCRFSYSISSRLEFGKNLIQNQ